MRKSKPTGRDRVLDMVETAHRILELWKRGQTNKYIASLLMISKSSVEKYKHKLRQDLGLTTVRSEVNAHVTCAECATNYAEYFLSAYQDEKGTYYGAFTQRLVITAKQNKTVLELWQCGESIESTAKALYMSPSNVVAARRTLKAEIGFDTVGGSNLSFADMQHGYGEYLYQNLKHLL